jgi:hypothetical protein
MVCESCREEFELIDILEDALSPDFANCPSCGRSIPIDPDYPDDSHDDETYE